MKSNILYLLLALVTGALIPIQASTNASFSKGTGSPTITGLMVFAIGLLSMLCFVFISKTPFPTIHQLAVTPLYSYLGGIIVAFYVVMITLLVPRIGVGTAIGFIVTGQILCAVIIDHFGLFAIPIRTIDVNRIVGILLMIGGVYLVMKK